MSSGTPGVLERLRQPDYTGENRCLPCTAVNVGIAVVLAVVVGVVSLPAGVAVLLGSMVAIYVRGYLVPGTPTLTRRYLPERVLAAFDKPPASAATAAADHGHDHDSASDSDSDSNPDPAADHTTPEAALLEAGVVAPCADVDDLCLETDVREDWHARIDALRDGDRERQFADALEFDPDLVEYREASDHVFLTVDGRRVGRWESDPALVADLAGFETLASRLPDWESLPADSRSGLVAGLRAFIERCPACDGAVSLDEETVESCCRSRDVYAITCEECGVRLMEVDR